MRIVQLVVKNPSELDFSLPLLWHLGSLDDPPEMHVVYLAADRAQMLRTGHGYTAILRSIGVKELDLADFLPGRAHRLERAWRSAFKKSYSDELSIREGLAALLGPRLRGPDTPGAAIRTARAVLDRARRKVEHVALRLPDVVGGLRELAPDVVLLGNRRAVTPFPGHDELFAWLRDEVPLVALVPHAAHETTLREFTPFQDEGDPLPPNVDFWITLEQTHTAEILPERAEQFAVVGNPGFDRGWVEWLRRRATRADPRPSVRAHCVVLGRKFHAPGAPRPSDPFTLSYEEGVAYFSSISESLATTGHEVAVTLKPHPSTNAFLLDRALTEAGCEHWRTSFDPLAALVAEADLLVGMFSTALILGVPFGIPVVVLPSRVQTFVEQEWGVMRELYRGLEHFVGETQAPASVLGAAVEQARGARRAETPDMRHLARFLPDSPLERCVERLARTPAGASG